MVKRIYCIFHLQIFLLCESCLPVTDSVILKYKFTIIFNEIKRKYQVLLWANWCYKNKKYLYTVTSITVQYINVNIFLNLSLSSSKEHTGMASFTYSYCYCVEAVSLLLFESVIAVPTSSVNKYSYFKVLWIFDLFRLNFCVFRFNRNTETRCFVIGAKQPKQTFCFG